MSCPEGMSKQIVSTDTDVETKEIPVNNGIQKVTTTTTRTKYSDGSHSTNTTTSSHTEFKSSSFSTQTFQNFGQNFLKENHANTRTIPIIQSDQASTPTKGSKEFSAFESDALIAHNAHRAKHGVESLTLNSDLCHVAQSWANTIAARGKLEHSRTGQYGENIYWTSGEIRSGSEPVDSWYEEVRNYRYGNSSYQPGTGHFTQIVWKRSTELGIAHARGKDGGTYVVANYNPAGNIQGQFHLNVMPT